MTPTARGSWETLAGKLNLFAVHTALYRLLGGRLVGRNILLLTTTGRRSGKHRCTPLFYARDGEDYLIVASNGGEDRYPGWWHNIGVNRWVTVQVGNRLRECSACEVAPGEAEALWPRLHAVYGGYRRYRERTSRPLTMFRLHPGEAAANGAGESPGTAAQRSRQGGGRSAWTG